jgi:HAD superfamily hydrolase (TIGR01549 family)
MKRLELLTIDCWGTILLVDDKLDFAIEQRIIDLIHRAHPSVDFSAISRAFAAEDEHYSNILRMEERTLASEERLKYIMEALRIPSLGDDSIRSMAREVDDVVQLEWPRLTSGSKELLLKANAVRLPVCLVSNTGWLSPYAVMATLEHYQLKGLISASFFSGDGFHAKPSPELFVAALEHFNCVSENAAHIGDQYSTDGLGALAAGIYPILVNDHRYDENDASADVQIVRSLNEAWSALLDLYNLVSK